MPHSHSGLLSMGGSYYVCTCRVCQKPAEQTLTDCKQLPAGGFSSDFPKGSAGPSPLLRLSSCLSSPLPGPRCREKAQRAAGLQTALLEVPQLRSISLSVPHTHTHSLSKPKPPTVALLLRRDAFYIMCASGPFHSGLFHYDRYTGQEKESVRQPCFGAAAESRSDHFYTYRFCAAAWSYI